MESKRFKVRTRGLIGLVVLLCLIGSAFLFLPAGVRYRIASASEEFSSSLNTERQRSYDLSDGGSYILYAGSLEVYNSSSHNIEHLYAQSWVDGANNCINDPFNMRLADKNVNEKRGNRYFADVTDRSNPVYDTNGKVAGYLGTDGEVGIFEPVNDKGDIARAILYMCIVYDLDYPYLSEMQEWANEKPGADEENHYARIVESGGSQRNLLIDRPYFSKVLPY